MMQPKQRNVVITIVNLLCMISYLSAAITTIMGKGTTSLLLSFVVCSYNIGVIIWIWKPKMEKRNEISSEI